FGAFADIGVHQDGLIHISAMAEKRISDPREVVRPGQVVKVKVLDIDVPRNRISLTLRLSDPLPQAGGQKSSGSAKTTARMQSSGPAKSSGGGALGGALAAAMAKAADRRKNS
ncbi:MAG TPA: S1 RNA-binding domain-containing protein, partial [Bradyrhizobium sp.]|nr:S1 RNA-binding domain-containing protein [Bradyrhizobium sp.]